MFKKITVLAMALGALTGFALPMSAAANWTKHDSAIQVNEQIALDGTRSFTSQDAALPGGIECDSTLKMQFLTGQTTGTIDQFTFTPPKTATEACVSKGGFKFCQSHTFEPTGLPWTIHTTQGAQPQITVTTGLMHTQLTGQFCPVQQQTTFTPFTWHLLPNNVQTTNTLTASGNTQIDYSQADGTVEPLVPAQIGGFFQLEVQNTYGI